MASSANKQSIGSAVPQNASTTSTVSVNEDVKKELDRVLHENSILKGRLRGFETLGTLFQEAKEKNKILAEQKNQLQQRLDNSIGEKLNKQSMASGNVITSLSDMNRVYNPDPSASSTDKDQTAVVMTNLPVHDNTVNIPTQESLENPIPDRSQFVTSNSAYNQNVRSSTENAAKPQALSEVFTAPEGTDNISVFDADKFNLSKSKTDVSSLAITSLDSNMISNDPSSSRISNDPSFNMISNDPSCNMVTIPSFPRIDMEQPSISSTVSSANEDPPAILSVQESLVNFDEEVKNMNTKLTKVQTENQKYKNVIKIITNENSQLKSEISQLRENKSKQSHKLKELEYAHNNGGPTSLTGENTEWVHVPSKTDQKENEIKQGAVYVDPKDKKIQELQKGLNSWKTNWNTLEHQYSAKIQSVKKELVTVKTQLEQMTNDQEFKQTEADKMLLNVKKRAADEEDAKQEAIDKLCKEKQEVSKLKLNIEQLESELSALKRSKSMLESKLAALKNTSGTSAGSDNHLLKEKDTEITVLREQISLITEDFERERSDRAGAQAAKNSAEEENQKLKTDKQNLNSQINRFTQQLQETEMSRRQLQNDHDNHQVHLHKLENELQRLRGQVNILSQRPNNTVPSRNIGRESQLSTIFPPLQSLEHLPGAWTCTQCTFINFPGRTVCEICGSITEDDNRRLNTQELQPRGVLSERDVEIDSCF